MPTATWDDVDPAPTALALAWHLPPGARVLICGGTAGGPLADRLRAWGLTVEILSTDASPDTGGGHGESTQRDPGPADCDVVVFTHAAFYEPAPGPYEPAKEPAGSIWIQALARLRPAGRVYLAIDQRAGGRLMFWAGRDIQVLPAELGVIEVTSLERRSVVRRLKAAGLQITRRWAAYPNLGRPGYLLPCQASGAPPDVERQVIRGQFAPLNRRGISSWLRAQAARLATWRRLRTWAPGLVLEAERTQRTRSPVSIADGPSFTAELASQALGSEVRPLMWMVRLTHAVVVPAWAVQQQQPVFVKLALSPRGAQSLADHVAFLRQLDALATTAGRRLPISRVLAAGQYRGQPLAIESALEGMGGGRIRLAYDRLLRGATETLIDFQQAMPADTARARQAWQQRIEALPAEPLLAGLDVAVLCDQALRRIASLRSALPAHNDYHLGNVIFSHQGQVTGILDWDLAERDGLPAVDLVHLLISVALRRRRKSKSAVIAELTAGGLPAEQAAWRQYARALDVPDSLADWMPLYLVTQLWRLTIQSRYDRPGTPGYRAMAEQARALVALGQSRSAGP